jgi:hypothetical protein
MPQFPMNVSPPDRSIKAMARQHRFTCDVCGTTSSWSADERLPPGWAVLTGTGKEISGPFPIRPVRSFDACSAMCIGIVMCEEQTRIALNQSPHPLTLEATDVGTT